MTDGLVASTQSPFRVAVVGLGKIGLPLAAMYASRGCDVVGCDVDATVVEDVNAGRCTIGEPGLRRLIQQCRRSGRLRASGNTAEAVRHCNVVVLIVPLLIDESHRPDFMRVDSAAESIAKGLQKDALVLVETTMPVGSTRQRLVPILEATGLAAGRDFKVAYSPERVSSGTIFRDLTNYPKVVGGINTVSATAASAFYTYAVGCEVLVLGSAEAAEFTKLIETTYRDVNIALANQYACYAAERGLDVMEAISAANTQPFSYIHTPGIGVGGHCIPVYPYFLTGDSQDLTLPLTARAVNDGMPEWSARLLDRELGGLAGSRILILGLAYRAEVAEHAFTPTVPLVAALQDRGASVLVHDAVLPDKEIVECGGEPASLERPPSIDAAVIQAWHKAYGKLDFSAFPGCRVVLDGRNRLPPGNYNGIRYIGIGRGQ